MRDRQRHADLLKRRARVAVEGGRTEKAGALLTELCQREPRDAEAWFLLGAVHGEAGRLPEAVECAQRAVALRPDWPEAHYNLGQAYMHQRHYEDAAECYREALRLRPDYAEAGNHLGYALLQYDRPAEAADGLQRVLDRHPDFAEAHSNLGAALLDLGNYDEAISRFRVALRIRPDCPGARNHLAHALILQGYPEKALEVCNETLRNDPADPETCCITKAGALDRLRRYREACELLRPLRESQVPRAGAAVNFARFAHHVDRVDEAADWLEGLLQSAALAPQARGSLHFALGRLYDRRREFDRAFLHYRSGNECKRASQAPVEPDRWRREVDAIIAAFGADALARRPRTTEYPQIPVFIVGMPRSGTSLVEQILASHPAVFGAGERREIGDLTKRLPRSVRPERPYPECIAHLDAERLQEFARDHLARLRRLAPDAQRITDKMPGNFFHLGLIRLLFPGARIIHCVRDPRDTCLSCYFQQFVGVHAYAYDLEHLGIYYSQYHRLMAHWRRVLDPPMLELRYEALVERPEEWSRALVDFCGLPWDERCLRFYESKRVVATSSYDQVRHPIYRGSLGRWRHYERHLAPLLHALGPQESEAAPADPRRREPGAPAPASRAPRGGKADEAP